MTTKFKTFKEWSAAGYKITKGSKATWVNNAAMFSAEQVSKKKRRSYPGDWAYDTIDYDDEFGDYYHDF